MLNQVPKTYILEYQGRAYPCELKPNRGNRHVRVRLVRREHLPEAAPHTFGISTQNAETQQLTLLEQSRTSYPVVCVSYPRRLAYRELIAAVERCAEWIAKHVVKWETEIQSQPVWTLTQGAQLPYQDHFFTLVVLRSEGRERIALEDTRLICRLRSDSTAYIKRRLVIWFRREAKRVVENRVKHWAPCITRKTFRIRIGKPRTRWGSCSASRTLSFNWKLIMAPEYVLDYIVIHELSHLEEMNHSKHYWAIVQAHCPDLARAKAWLKKNGRRLDSYQLS